MLPPVCPRHKPWHFHPGFFNNSQICFQFLIGCRSLFYSQLFKHRFIINHDVFWRVMPDLQPVKLSAADAGCLSGFRHDILPLCSGKIYTIFFRIPDIRLNCSDRIGLNPEDIRTSSVYKAGLKNILILIGRNRLNIHGYAVGIFKTPNRFVISIVHPACGNKNAEFFPFKLTGIFHRFDSQIFAVRFFAQRSGYEGSRRQRRRFFRFCTVCPGRLQVFSLHLHRRSSRRCSGCRGEV